MPSALGPSLRENDGQARLLGREQDESRDSAATCMK